ncbi:MAG TPA: HEPN domain-containing protein [Urbifossiella sp.]|jgi:hypothetical protein|nr:HEPN domain-containing protein [Urbifossiella sp.]
MPADADARKYYRAAGQRWDEAKFLQKADMPVGAVYLAGYCVECMLKALILCQTPPKKRSEVRELFRGGKAHDYDWLRERYRLQGGSTMPPDVVQAFSEVIVWETDLRYEPGTMAEDDVLAFMRAADAIRSWADRRMN